MVILADILAARQVVRPHIRHTPLAPSPALSQLSRGQVYLKLECWQRTGSFKERGALTKLTTLTAEEWSRGVVTASSGNHGLGVAYASQVFGLPPALIFVPETAPAAKVERLTAFDCEVRRAGTDYDATHVIAEAYAQEQGAVYVSAYDDPVIIIGQGTIGLEIMEDLPDADVILVPAGGGGLIAGIAVAVQAINPAVRIIGVQPEACPAAYLSLRDGQPYETYPTEATICDGSVGGFGRLPFEIAGDLIDEVLVVPEADVRRAVGWLAAQEQIIVEGAAALAITPLLNGMLDAEGQNVVSVLTGRNIDVALLGEILAEQEPR